MGSLVVCRLLRLSNRLWRRQPHLASMRGTHVSTTSSTHATKAVILAAGRGNRISGVMGSTPKPLLPLDGRPGSPTFLDWHVHCLLHAGVQEIFIVGNHATCGWTSPFMPAAHVQWILNPTEDLTTSGSGHSTWFAWHHSSPILDGRSTVLLMDADIVYHPDVLRRALDQPALTSRTLVCADYRNTQEEVLVFGKNGLPLMHGKGLPGTPMVQDMDCLGEATGILQWHPRDHQALRVTTDWLVQYGTARTRLEHEDITQQMMHMKRVEAWALANHDLFMEVDTPDEYATLTRDVVPRLVPLAPGLFKPVGR